MPKKAICKVTWLLTDPLGMASVGEESVTKMTLNPAVPIPKVSMEDMTVACALVRTLFPNRLGDADQRLAFLTALMDLDAKLHDQTMYVDGVANGSVAIITGCSFTPTTGARGHSVVPGQVLVIKLKAIAGGSFRALTTKPLGATGLFMVIFTQGVYELELVGNQLIVPDGAKGVILVPRGVGKMVFSGFSAFPSISFVAYAMNAAGISAVSGVFSTKIL